MNNKNPGLQICSILLLPVFLFGFIACQMEKPMSEPVSVLEGGRFEVIVLGMAQDGGLPHLGCTRSCCEDARRKGEERYPACLGIHDRQSGALVLIEATPAIEKQIALLHGFCATQDRERKPVDAVLITHAHIGHYTGLIQFGREVASTKSIPLHVTKRMEAFLQTNGPWRQLIELGQVKIIQIEARASFEPMPGLVVTAIPVPHRDEFSDTVAFKIKGPKRQILFVPDIDCWQDELLSELLDGVDVAYLDGTFYDGSELPGRDITKIPHPLMVDSMKRLAKEALEHPGRFRFIHLNHTNPALVDPKIQAEIHKKGFRIAERGERVGL